MRLFSLSILSGALMIFCFRPPELPWTMAFCFVPLWYYWMSQPGMGKVFLSGWIAQFVLSAGACYWVADTADLFFGAPGWMKYAYLFGFSCIGHISYPIAGVCWYWAFRRFELSRNRALALLVLTTAFFDVIFPRVFPLTFGDSWLYLNLPVVQLLDIFGFMGLTVFVFTLNAVWLSGNKPIGALAINTCLVIVACLLGTLNEMRWDEPNGNLKVHLFQSNFEPIETLTQSYGKEEAIELTLKYFFSENKPDYQSGDPDLVLWAETAMPFDVTRESEYLTHLQNYVRGERIFLLTGAYRYGEMHTKYNSAALFGPNGKLIQIYDKTMLMPFGEYLPFENTFPVLREWAPQLPRYGAGRDYKPFVLGDARLGPSICYEALFPSHFRELTNAGANVFFNITSDFWFGNTTEGLLHGLASMGRALEFRRPIIRIADTGPTIVVLANGTIQALPPTWEPWQGYVNVPYLRDPPRTFFDRYGEWWPALIIIAAFAICVWPAPKRYETNLEKREESKASNQSAA